MQPNITGLTRCRLTGAIEARWPVALTNVAALMLARGLPDRLRLESGVVQDVQWLFCLCMAIASLGGMSR